MDESSKNPDDPLRPSWGPQSILLYAKPSQLTEQTEQSTQTGSAVLQKNKKSSSPVDVSTGHSPISSYERAQTDSMGTQLISETLVLQRRNTYIKLGEDDVPFARARYMDSCKDIASEVHHSSHYEQTIWELAAILFDTVDLTAYTDLPKDDADDYVGQIRKDNLSKFWGKICQPSAHEAVSAAANAEERALAYLSANELVNACEALTQGKDYRLAILISQLPSDTTTREAITAQIEHWRELKALSEMTEPIRALYELLTGNTCECRGKRGAHEDRTRTFIVHERLKLDWRRAFGLRLWYSILPENSLEYALLTYEMDSDKEKAPLPSFSDDDASGDWHKVLPPSRRDILWGLLKLYAMNDAPSIAETVAPHNVTSDPFDARLSFQLYHTLTITGEPEDAPEGNQITW